jgi:2-iminobutanoate/2-iminopropanoate deaminase
MVIAMTRVAIHTSNAPHAHGPYSQAIVAHGFVFCSGQTPVDPTTGSLIDGDIAAQTRQCLLNLSAVLAAAGTSWDHAVKVTVFLSDINDFAAMNAVYAEHMPSSAPARSTVAVKDTPLGSLIVMDVIALQP